MTFRGEEERMRKEEREGAGEKRGGECGQTER